MITIRIPVLEEVNDIKALLSKYGVDCTRVTKNINDSMVVLDGEKIIGYGSYNTVEIKDKNIGIIDTILIRKEFRNQYIGDGLVKALLNLADKKGIIKVYSLSNKEKSLFYKKLGFIESEKLDEYLIKEITSRNIPLNEVKIYKVKLPDFFNKACRSSKT